MSDAVGQPTISCGFVNRRAQHPRRQHKPLPNNKILRKLYKKPIGTHSLGDEAFLDARVERERAARFAHVTQHSERPINALKPVTNLASCSMIVVLEVSTAHMLSCAPSASIAARHVAIEPCDQILVGRHLVQRVVAVLATQATIVTTTSLLVAS